MKPDLPGLEVVARILGWSTLFGMALALVWFSLYASGLLCSLPLFDLTPHECGVITYGGIGLLKLIVYTLFLVPWLAIRLELRRQRRSHSALKDRDRQSALLTTILPDY